ncbi:MAG: hypothetical protein S4CHLAM2_04060 [Chlamydiales bacterium]|nr:hypothetical protein [Chlamydiales bacterium]
MLQRKSSEKEDEDLTQPLRSLIDFFKNAPLQEVEIDAERNKDLEDIS